MIQIIGLTGKAGAGKTLFADCFVQYGFKKLSFSTALKEMLLKGGMATKEELYSTKPENVRWLLQKIGTNIIRNQVDPDYWVQKLDEEMWKCYGKGATKFVIDDIRFRNEAEFVRSLNGDLIRIIRPTTITNELAGHISETEMDEIEVDETWHNDTEKSRMYEKVKKYLDSYKRFQDILV